MDITDSETSYVIKLDHIDVNYISNFNFESNDGLCPLWSTKNKRNEDFFEFKVLAQRRSDSICESIEEDDDTISHPLYRCGICDRDIPLAYKTDHNNSPTHKTSVKIAEAVLQRVQRQLLVEDTQETITNSSHTYFCETCTVIVKKKDKTQHDSSDAHKKSTIYDSCLKDLLNLYLDKYYLDTADTGYLKLLYNKKGYDFNPNKISNTEEDIADNNKRNDLVNHENSVKTNENDTDSHFISQAKKKKRKKNKKQKRVELPNSVDTDVDIHIHIIDNPDLNSSISKPFDDQEYINSSNNSEEFTVSNTDLLYDEHTHSNDAQNISTDDVIDDNSIEEEFHSIDLNINVDSEQSDGNNDTMKDDYENKNETQIIDHGNQTNNNSETQQTDSKDITVNSNKNEVICEPSTSKSVDYIMSLNPNEFTINTKTETKKHNSVLGEADFKKYIDVVSLSHKMKLVNKDYIEIQTLDDCVVTVKADNFNGFVVKDSKLQCRVCMMMIDEDPADHIYKFDHLSRVTEPIKDLHCFREVSNSYQHCIHCNDNFSNFEFHKLLDCHLNALKVAMTRAISAKPVANKKGKTFCAPCNTYIDSHNFNAHTNGKLHKNNLSLFFTSQTKETGNSQSNDEKILCEPCNYKIPLENFPAHLYGKNHKAALLLANNSRLGQPENFCATCDFYTKKLSSHITEEYHDYHVKKHKTIKKNDNQIPSTSDTNYHIKVKGSEATCRICDVQVPNKAENITEHTKGRSHKTLAENLFTKNRLTKTNNKLFCEMCNIPIEPTKELDHIEIASHKIALKQLDSRPIQNTKENNAPVPLYHCEFCDVDIIDSPESIRDHQDDMFHKISCRINDAFDKVTKAIAEPLHHHFETKSKTIDTISCRLCKVEFRFDNSKQHLESITHNINFRKVLIENKIQKVNNKYSCQICSVEIKDREELKHIQSPSHLKEKQNVMSGTKGTGYRCVVCRVDVPNNLNNISMHEQGNGHMTRLKKLTIDEEEVVLMTNAQDGKQKYCIICKATVALKGVPEHVRGIRHRTLKILATTKS